MWRESSLLCDRAVHIMQSQTNVFADPKLRKSKLNGIWTHAISKMWIESTGNRWNSSGKNHRIHYVGNSRRDSKDDGGIMV